MRIRTRWWGLAMAVVALAMAAPPALAAFPGANGQLAVAPTAGGGVIVASPQTGRARRLCDAPQTCGRGPLTGPHFSPNGRELVFTDGDGRLETSTIDGACVWCLTSLPNVVLRGTSPAFTSDGATITYVHHGLWEIAPGSAQPTRLRVLGGPVSAAVWSPGGRPAVVRRGWLWTGLLTSGKVLLINRLTRGSAPVWSPDGRTLAFVHDGVVSTMGIRAHRITRMARGSSPAFSPDGHALAYLNRRHQVTIRSLGRGHTRTLTHLTGRALDWEPVTTVTRRGCAAGNGVVVARNATAVIRAAANAQRTHIAWNGCLKTLGVPFHLNGGLTGEFTSLTLGLTALAGHYAALQFIYNDKDQGYTDTIDVYDLRSGALVRSGPVRCAGFPCDVAGLTVSTDGFAAWHAYDTPQRPEEAIYSLTCPSDSLCLGSDAGGDLLVSSDPTGGRSAWKLLQAGADIPTTVNSVSCPTLSFCVAAGGAGQVLTSTDPTGGPGAWHVSRPSGQTGLADLTCASPTLCAAVTNSTVYTSTDPTVAWHASQVTVPGDLLTGASCPSTTLCVLTTSKREVLITQDPGDPAPLWSPPAPVPGAAQDFNLPSLTCPSAGFCAAVADSDAGNQVLTTTDPAGGAGTWTAHTVPGVQWVTCPSTALCVAFGGNEVATSTDPTAPSATWNTSTLGIGGIFIGTCPTTSLCVAAAGSDAVVSTNPAAGSGAWSSFLVAALPCDPATPCRAETLQALDQHGVETLDSAPEGTGTVIGNPKLTGNTVTWTHDGAPRSAALS